MPEPVTTEELVKKIKALDFQLKHTPDKARRVGLVRYRNQLAEQYNRLTGKTASASAYQAFRDQLADDTGYLDVWHDNLACAVIDEAGVDWIPRNGWPSGSFLMLLGCAHDSPKIDSLPM